LSIAKVFGAYSAENVMISFALTGLVLIAVNHDGRCPSLRYLALTARRMILIFCPVRAKYHRTGQRPG
jgi:hypothetical protein